MTVKLTITKIIEMNQAIPHYRWVIKDKNMATVHSTKTRSAARAFVRHAKNIDRLQREATQ